MLKEDSQSLYEQENAVEQAAELILHNDDFNTFDFVIDCLMEICGHTNIQAEQLAILVHYKGKATVKKGAYDLLLGMYNSLSHRNLTAELIC